MSKVGRQLTITKLQPGNSGGYTSKTSDSAAELQDEETAWADQAKSVFTKHDTNGDGCLDEEEFSAVLMAISNKFTNDDVRKMLRQADINQDGRISTSEFVDWLTGKDQRRNSVSMGPSKSLGRTVAENSQGLELLFNVYDKDGTHMISKQQFQECHAIMASALRLSNIDDADDHRNADVKHDREEALELFAEKTCQSGMVGFLDFVNWMKQHIPIWMNQSSFYEFTVLMAGHLEESFKHGVPTELGYIKESASVSGHITDKFSESLKLLRKDGGEEVVEKRIWDNPPQGLSFDRLKAAHMMVMPLNMKVVKNLSWELLCLPTGSAGSEVWKAEVVRRVLMHNGKLRVEPPCYYKYDVDDMEWVVSEGDVSVFEFIQPGLGLFCLLKTAADFGPQMRWAQIEHSLEGGIDMRLIREEGVEKFNEHVIDMVLDQMKDDGVKSGDTLDVRLKYAKRYIANELEIKPAMVMVTLLQLDLVERDPAWERFVQDDR